jgi:beta-phosphoglucomutase-like phosphatase (HAD superfamily)
VRAAALLGIDPGRCIAVEDSGVGVQAARAAGMFCVAVRNPDARTRQDLAAADVEISSLQELKLGELLLRV